MFHAIKTLEYKISFVFSLLIAILFAEVLNHFYHGYYIGISDSLLGSIKLIATISATLAGFFVTTISILIALPEKQPIRLIKKAGHFEDFPGFILLSAIYLFLSLIASFINIILGISNYVYMGVLLFLLSGSAINSGFSMIILASLIDYSYQ